MAEALLNVTGPVIAGVILVVAAPAVGLLATAGLAVAGTGLFLRSPALRRWPAPGARPAADTAGAAPASGWSSWPSARPGMTWPRWRGFRLAPALATAYVLAGTVAAPRARNRAGNWVSSGYNAGAATGTVLAGQLIGRLPLTACLPVLMAPALLALVPLLRTRLASAPPATGTPLKGRRRRSRLRSAAREPGPGR